MWSQAYFFRLGDEERVVRFADTAWNFEQDRWFARFGAEDLPVPAVLEIGDAFDGHSYAVSTRAHGHFLEQLGVQPTARALPSVLRTLDAMRAVDLAGTTGFGSLLPTFDGERSTWRDFLLAVDDDDPALEANPVRGWRPALDRRPDAARVFDDAYAALAAGVDACPEVRHVVHGDLLHRNVLVDHDRVSAVFDWQCALHGDFVYDVALLAFWAPWFPPLAAADVASAARRHYDDIGLEVPELGARMRCYALHIGLAHLGYHAWTGAWHDLDLVARRTREVLDGATGF
jgi:hygromycin-B 4-O-kinase